MVSIIYDRCETPECRNLALPNQRLCAVCQSRLVDGHTRPPRVNSRRTPPDEVISQLQEYITALLHAKKQLHKRIMALTDQLDREALYAESQQRQLEALRRTLMHNIIHTEDQGDFTPYILELEHQIQVLRRQIVRPDPDQQDEADDGLLSAVARTIRRLIG